jgi:protein CpxP
MITSRTVLALAAVAALGTGVAAWSPLAQAQSATSTTGMPAAPAAAAPNASMPAAAAPSSTAPAAPKAAAQAVKPQSDAQVEAHIKQLHSQLKITSAQEDSWKAMAQDMRDNAKDMSGLIQARNSTKPMTAVDNLKNYEQIADAHADGLKKIVPDFEKLYDSMSPAQKKTADTVFNQRVNQRVRTTAAPSSAPTKG